MMNFQEYMDKVEEKLSRLSEDEKTALLRNLLRGAKDNKREEMLLALSTQPQDSSFQEEIEGFETWCEELKSGELYFYVSGYDEYQEAPWGEEYYEEYEDRHKIDRRYKEFMEFGEKLLYSRKYKEALYFYETLLEMDFYAYNEESGDLVEISLEQAIDEELINIKYRNSILHLLYLIYQIFSGDKRCLEIYRILGLYRHEEIKIDDFFSVGPDVLENREGFMEEWIKFLSSNKEDYAAALLYEASYLKGKTDYLVKTARLAGDIHPMLYLNACVKLCEEERYDEVLTFASEAMDKLSRNLVIRSEIAKAGYLAAEALNHQDAENKFMRESYYSGTSPLMFLELCRQSEWEELEYAARHAESLPLYDALESDERSGQWKINSITTEEKEAILFFSGKWDILYEKYNKENESLGWSLSSKGIIISLFLLALYNDDELQKAGRVMWDTVLHRLGSSRLDEEDMNDVFINWRRRYQMNEEHMEKYFPWIKEEIENRVTGIVENSYRKSYHKAALLIGVLGEVLESRGENDAKNNLITFYKKKYSRRSAFRAELDILL